MRLHAYRNPRNLDAIRDGRSQPPPIPPEFYWVEIATYINARTHSNYKTADLKQMPADELEALLVYVGR